MVTVVVVSGAVAPLVRLLPLLMSVQGMVMVAVEPRIEGITVVTLIGRKSDPGETLATNSSAGELVVVELLGEIVVVVVVGGGGAVVTELSKSDGCGELGAASTGGWLDERTSGELDDEGASGDVAIGASVGCDGDASDGEADGEGELVSVGAGVEGIVGEVSWEVITVFAPASGCSVEPLTASSSLTAAALSIATGGLVGATGWLCVGSSLGGCCSASVGFGASGAGIGSTGAALLETGSRWALDGLVGAAASVESATGGPSVDGWPLVAS